MTEAPNRSGKQANIEIEPHMTIRSLDDLLPMLIGCRGALFICDDLALEVVGSQRSFPRITNFTSRRPPSWIAVGVERSDGDRDTLTVSSFMRGRHGTE